MSGFQTKNRYKEVSNLCRFLRVCEETEPSKNVGVLDFGVPSILDVLYAFIGSYNMNGFIGSGDEPGKPPEYAHIGLYAYQDYL